MLRRATGCCNSSSSQRSSRMGAGVCCGGWEPRTGRCVDAEAAGATLCCEGRGNAAVFQCLDVLGCNRCVRLRRASSALAVRERVGARSPRGKIDLYKRGVMSQLAVAAPVCWLFCWAHIDVSGFNAARGSTQPIFCCCNCWQCLRTSDCSEVASLLHSPHFPAPSPAKREHRAAGGCQTKLIISKTYCLSGLRW